MFRRRRKHSDFSAEIEAHIRLEEDRLREEGLSPEDARAAALRAFGNRAAVEERFFEESRWAWWDALRQDLRYALRTLSRSPGFSAAAALTLALGIGANTAIFSVIDAVLLRQPPYPGADRLVVLYGRSEAGGHRALSPADFLDYRAQVRSFRGLAAYSERPVALTGRDRPEIVRGAIVTEDFFSLLATAAIFGRTFVPEREKPGAPPAAVLGFNLWRNRFGGDARIVNAVVGIDGEPVTVVGVMPRGFEFPPGCELWISSRFAAPAHPLRPAEDPSRLRDTHYLDLIGRLRPGVSHAAARAEADAVARRLKKHLGEAEDDTGADLVVLHEDLVGSTRAALSVLLGAVTLLLLIACANVANIVLARGTARQREIAIRGALGAGRSRLVRQLLTESVVLAGAGGALGILFAHWAMGPLRAMVPGGLLGGSTLRLDPRVLLFTAAVSLTCGAAFGVFPALQLAGGNFAGALTETGRAVAGGWRAQRTRSVLVVAEIALAAMLLVGAGLLVRSFERLLSAPQGFRAENVLTLQLTLPAGRYPTAKARAAFVRGVTDGVRALPGVSSAGVVSRLPLNRGASTRTIDILGRTLPANEVAPDYQVVGPDYFVSLGIPILKGRPFTERDDARAPGVFIVNAAMARHFFPGEEPIGKRLKAGVRDEWSEIVGVAGDVLQRRLDQPAPPIVYVPYAQDPWPSMTLVVRTKTDPASAASAVEGAIHSVDKDEAVSRVRTMTQVVSESVAAQRLRMMLLGLFAFLALTLACVGLYGVMAYSVAQRSREIGIRMALGAQPRNVLGAIVAQGLKLALTGLAAGLVLSVLSGRLLSSLLFGVRATDAATFAGIAVLLTAVALLASYIPAWRATRVDPVIALRME